MPPFYYASVISATQSSSFIPWQLSGSLLWFDYDDSVQGTGGSAGKIASLTDKVAGYTFTTSVFGLSTYDNTTLPGHVVALGVGNSSGLSGSQPQLVADTDSNVSGFTWATYAKLGNEVNAIVEIGPRLMSGASLVTLVPNWRANAGGTTAQFILSSGNIAFQTSVGVPIPDNAWHSWTVTWNKVAGLVTASMDNGAYVIVASGVFGSNWHGVGVGTMQRNTASYMAAHGLWGRVLSDSDVSNIHTYLHAHYGS